MNCVKHLCSHSTRLFCKITLSDLKIRETIIDLIFKKYEKNANSLIYSPVANNLFPFSPLEKTSFFLFGEYVTNRASAQAVF
jgi:hypothetical protein